MHFVSRLRRSRWPGGAHFCPNYPVILHVSWYRKKKLSDPLQKKKKKKEKKKKKKKKERKLIIYKINNS